ncbi:MAG: TonB-dependent receptor [Gammaproteobacteria bacterium]|nr:TonB-dependent receptor [Gammaproteobacteria bacterium]
MKRIPGVVLLVGAWLLPVDDVANAQGAQRGVVDEIVVTAQRREESLLEVPIAITALDGSFLEQRQAFTTETLSLYTPSLHIYAEAVNTEFYTIRGIGRANEDLASDSGVAVFVDDVYIARQGAANLAMFDIERVEVLRGPQGTLWGKNTTGGAVNIVTKRPGDTASAYVGADIGDYGTMNLRAGGSAPLIDDKLYGRLAFSSRDRDGLYRNLTTGERGNNIDSKSVRGSLRFVASEATEIFFSADWEKTDQDGVLKSVIVDVPGTQYILKDFFVVSEFPTQESRLRSSRSGDHGEQGLEAYGLNLTIQHEFSFADFVSITGYRKEDSFHTEDNDRASDMSAVVFSEQDTWTFSQELRLQSRDEGAWTWTAGLYWFHEDGDRDQSRYSDFFGPGGLVGPGSPDTQQAITTFEQGLETDSIAAFGQVTYNFTDQLSVTAGGRYTYDKKDYTINAFAVPITPGGSSYSLFIPDGPFMTTDSESWSEFTPKIAVEYGFNENSNVYAYYARGFKSGGYNGSPDNTAGVVPFEPETVDTFEIGLKSRFLEDRMQIGIAGFFNDFEDMQLQGFDPVTGSPITNNAASAEILGIELEVDGVIGENFSYTFGGSYLDHEFKDYFIEVFDPTIMGGPPFRVVDKEGDRIGVIPEYNAHLGAQYVWPLSSGAEIALSGDLSLMDKTITVFNTKWSDSYEVVDMRLKWIAADQRWDAAFWINNVTDEDYYRGGGPVPDIDDKIARLGLVQDPRIYGVSFTWRFDGE